MGSRACLGFMLKHHHLLQEAGQEMIGKSASELREIEDTDINQFEEIMSATQHRAFLFKIKVAEETYNDETRIKSTIVR